MAEILLRLIGRLSHLEGFIHPKWLARVLNHQRYEFVKEQDMFHSLSLKTEIFQYTPEN